MKDERSSFLFAIKSDSEQINKLKGLLVLNYNLDIRSRMVWNGDKMNSLVVDKKLIWLIKSLKRCIVYSVSITHHGLLTNYKIYRFYIIESVSHTQSDSND